MFAQLIKVPEAGDRDSLDLGGVVNRIGSLGDGDREQIVNPAGREPGQLDWSWLSKRASDVTFNQVRTRVPRDW